MALFFEVKVVPSSGRNKWVIEPSGRLKCYLKSPPEKGLANKELIKLIAKVLGVAKADVEIISGLTSRNKRIRVCIELDFDQFLGKLGLGRQQSLL